MTDIQKFKDGEAICIGDDIIADMGRDASLALQDQIKSKIENSGMHWTFERDEMRREVRIVPHLKERNDEA